MQLTHLHMFIQGQHPPPPKKTNSACVRDACVRACLSEPLDRVVQVDVWVLVNLIQESTQLAQSWFNCLGTIQTRCILFNTLYELNDRLTLAVGPAGNLELAAVVLEHCLPNAEMLGSLFNWQIEHLGGGMGIHGGRGKQKNLNYQKNKIKVTKRGMQTEHREDAAEDKAEGI